MLHYRFTPKSIICLKEGLTRRQLVGDLVAGLTVGIIALPLAMAFGIASIPPEVAREAGLSPPAMGLYTAVIAGFLISLLGGSRVQIGGPTGAFIVIVYGIASEYGYGGLATATFMAGILIALMGIFRMGAMIKFIPYPVTTGFTTGIAVIIFATQLKDFFGLRMEKVPAEFIEKIEALLHHAGTYDVNTLGVAAVSLAMLIFLRKFAPRLPGAVITVLIVSILVALLGLPVETIESRFGAIPRGLPRPHLPPLSFEAARNLVPEAVTIAILAAIESLLSAVVADGMTGRRHKADCELLAQGAANVGSVLFGGIPATGAIARTTMNIKSGGKTPLAGMVHALTLLAVMAALAPLAGRIPLATLSAVLMMVAWNMSELHHFVSIHKAPRGDVLVLWATFILTVLVDLTVAVGVGMVLASLLFMRRMAEVSEVQAVTDELNEAAADEDETGMADPDAIASRAVPVGVEVYEINGPFFFGIADRLHDTLRAQQKPPKIFILRMRKVPVIDATGMHALREFHHKCHKQGTTLLLSGVGEQPRRALIQAGLVELLGRENVLPHIDLALARARSLLHLGGPGAPNVRPTVGAE